MGNIDYEEKLTQIEEEGQQKLTEAEETYGGMIDEAQKYYQSQIDATKQWATTQQNLQQQQTDFTISQINQQKEQAEKSYKKEQSGAYADWQKESNQYGANAEQLAASGLSDSGYSESSQVAMYNAYQNRVATARESYNQAVLNYNNAIKEAQLQNSSALAEIAYTALQQQLELSLQGFQYENELVFALEDRKTQIESTYHGQYMDVLNEMNREREFQEQIRQYEEEMARLKALDEEDKRRYDEEMSRLKALDEEDKRRYDLEMERIKALDEEEKNKANEAEQDEYFLTPDKETETIKSGVTEKSLQSYRNATYARNEAKIQDVLKDLNKDTGSNLSNTQTTEAKEKTKTTPAPVPTPAPKNEPYEYGTPYFRGSYNEDIQRYGTFDNGYQPKGVGDHGRLTKTGKKQEVRATVLYGKDAGKTNKIMQNVWKAEDGTLWLWNGTGNCYEEYLG